MNINWTKIKADFLLAYEEFKNELSVNKNMLDKYDNQKIWILYRKLHEIIDCIQNKQSVTELQAEMESMDDITSNAISELKIENAELQAETEQLNQTIKYEFNRNQGLVQEIIEHKAEIEKLKKELDYYYNETENITCVVCGESYNYKTHAIVRRLLAEIEQFKNDNATYLKSIEECLAEIETLKSGNYNLMAEVNDEANEVCKLKQQIDSREIPQDLIEAFMWYGKVFKGKGHIFEKIYLDEWIHRLLKILQR